MTHHADTEVLIHGYEEWDSDLVNRLRGMFAFALVDLRAQRVVLARDRFGEKPLYIASVASGLAFASELKALNQGVLKDKSISVEALGDYLRLGYIPAPRTIYSCVTKLKAAEIGISQFDDVRLLRRSTYWDLKYSGGRVQEKKAWQEEFLEKLSESIQLRLMSDVPLGAFLSGGLDSSMIVRGMIRGSVKGVKTFTIGFEEPAYDESGFARRIAAFYETDHHSRQVGYSDLLKYVPSMSAVFDEPFADASVLPTLALAQLARDSVTVALSGDGGDEMLAGYSRYALNACLSKVLDHWLGELLCLMWRPILAHWPQNLRGRGIVDLIRMGSMERYELCMTDGWLLRKSRIASVNGQWNFGRIWDEGTENLIDRMCKADVRCYIPEDLMVKMDRSTMAVSLEARAPLLDHHLFEFVAASPLEYRFAAGMGKLPFREVLARDHGQAFAHRTKQGFGVPLGAWFRNELNSYVTDVLCSRNAFVQQVFPEAFIRGLLVDHRRGSRDQSNRIWILLVLELWHHTYGGNI